MVNNPWSVSTLLNQFKSLDCYSDVQIHKNNHTNKFIFELRFDPSDEDEAEAEVEKLVPTYGGEVRTSERNGGEKFIEYKLSCSKLLDDRN